MKEVNLFDGKLGQHCESTTIGAVLKNIDLNLSEEMIFGLGEGLGYIVFKFGDASFPFIGGRKKTAELFPTVCENLGLEAEIKRTTSVKKAWINIKEELDKGNTVGLQLDSYYLDYFEEKVHFAGHFASIVDYDEEFAYMIDTNRKGINKTTLENLSLARNAKGPMAGKNLSFVIKGKYDESILKEAIIKSIKNNAKTYLNPPIKNLGYKGILKTAKELPKCFDQSKNIEYDFNFTAMMIEKAGTGGGMFRKIYSKFLNEAYEVVGDKILLEASKDFKISANIWTEVSTIFEEIAVTKDKNKIKEISDKLEEISKIEFEAMNNLIENL